MATIDEERRDAILRLMFASRSDPRRGRAAIDDECASTRSGGSLDTIIHHEGSALARSASQSYLASASAHSQDQGPDGRTEVVCEEEGIQAPLEEQAVRGATRQIDSLYLLLMPWASSAF